MTRSIIRPFLNLLPLIFFIVGCSSSPKLETVPISLDADPTEQLDMMKADLQRARINNVNTLSPNWYEKAEKSYKVSRSIHSKGGSIKKIFDNLSVAKAQLKRAEQLAPVAKIVLVPVIEERNKALAAGANQSTNGFEKAEKEFIELTSLVENDKRSKAEKKSPEVKQMFNQVELTAITDRALTPARNRLNEAVELGAKKLAPESMKLAQKNIEDATNFIKKERYNSEEIAEKADMALFMSDRLVTLTKEAKNIDKQSPEETALRIESINERVATNLDLPDIRNLDFSSQTNEIVRSIANVKDVQQSLQSKHVNLEQEVEKMNKAHDSQVKKIEGDRNRKLATLRKELRAEANVLNRLKKEQELDQMIQKIENNFSENEAEVYRQGNKLVFRLRGADFPVGESTIPTKNYSLLNKVTNSLKQIDNSKIIVEGHTDSIGKAEVNEKLSELRAKAVSEYLISQGVVAPNSVETKGLGYRRPIATNKTADGRRKNRRIDVIVELKKTE